MQRGGKMNERFLDDKEGEERDSKNNVSDGGMNILSVEPLVREPEDYRYKSNKKCDGIAQDAGSHSSETFKSSLCVPVDIVYTCSMMYLRLGQGFLFTVQQRTSFHLSDLQSEPVVFPGFRP